MKYEIFYTWSAPYSRVRGSDSDVTLSS